MGMTRQEYNAKKTIYWLLVEEGYVTYARLFAHFDFHFTNDPEAVAYMIPDKYVIVVNRGLDKNQVSVAIRHEILHQYLRHMQRMEKKLGKEVWLNRTADMHQSSNIAGDYDICNQSYSEADKDNIRSIVIDGRKVGSGLITEDDHPEWVNLSFEEMYDKVQAEMKKDYQDMQNDMQQQGDSADQDGDGQSSQNSGGQNQNGQSDNNESQEYLDSYNKIIDAFNSGKLTIEDISNFQQGKITQDDVLRKL